MAVDYRLRQIALVSADLEATIGTLARVFGLKVAFRDPGVAAYGLVNAVLPVGCDFLEVVQPVVADCPAGRYMQRRGGDGGYMVILQTADAIAQRKRLAAAGVIGVAHMGGDEDAPAAAVDFPISPEVAAQIKEMSRRYAYTHFHPKTFMGVLASIDSTIGDAGWLRAESDWLPAGENWRAARSSAAQGLVAVIVQHADPVAAAARWSSLLDVPPLPGKPCELRLSRGCIRFDATPTGGISGVAGIDIAVADPAAIFSNATAAGLATTPNGAIIIAGTAFRPVPAGVV